MPTALITGISGQDGSYLAELLLAKGYRVHGLVRRSSEIARHRIDHLHHGDDSDRIELHYGDLDDPLGLVRIITEVEPDEIYHLAAQSHVAVSFELPDYTGSVTGLGTMRLLEAIRVSGVPARFYQASSSEMFGSAPPPQNELTPFQPRSPYAVAKVYRFWATVNYRTTPPTTSFSPLVWPTASVTFASSPSAMLASTTRSTSSPTPAL